MNSVDELEKLAGIKKEIQLPQKEMDSDFAERVAKEIKKKDANLMYDNNAGEIVEVVEWYDDSKDRTTFSRKKVDSVRLQSVLEKHFAFYRSLFNKKTECMEIVFMSPNKKLLDLVACNDEFRNSIKKFSLIVESPFIYIKNNSLQIAKKGYDEDCCVFTKHDAPDIKEMPLHEAKALLEEVLVDFPFSTPQDKTNAISMFITPMLRGLYRQYGVRTPFYLIMANQQGTGKDCLHACVTIIYTGRKIEESPLSSEKGCNPEETQKRLMAAARSGQQFLHFGNNKGNISDATIEYALTSATVGGRILGTDKDAYYENIFEFSGTGNLGVTYTRDFARRILPINLFCPDEDTTKRTFKHADIEGWVLENRSKFLSAIYSIIKCWWNKGKPDGTGVFNSYPIWSKFISGIMVNAGYDDPCNTSSIQSEGRIGGDAETADITLFMKTLGDYLHDPKKMMGEHQQQNITKGFTKKEIFAIYSDLFYEMDDKPFGYFKLSEEKDKREFGRILNRYVGMIRGGYIFNLFQEKSNAQRNRFKFEKVSQLSQLSKNLPTSQLFENILNIKGGSKTETVKTVETDSNADILAKTSEIDEKTVKNDVFEPKNDKNSQLVDNSKILPLKSYTQFVEIANILPTTFDSSEVYNYFTSDLFAKLLINGDISHFEKSRYRLTGR
jgi:hypothetical protein